MESQGRSARSTLPAQADPVSSLPVENLSPNRSLQRGLMILRCFRPGLGALCNMDLVEKTGLPKATVSRLTKTLVNNGFLRRVAGSNEFRLSYSVLSLAHAVMLDSQVAHEALPLMQDLGEDRSINVGLSVRDELEMVYLHVVYGDSSRDSRRIEAGHRKPLEINAVGRAYLAALEKSEREALLRRCAARHPEDRWQRISCELDLAFQTFEREGYCSVVWNQATESIAVPLILTEGVFVTNVSFNINDYSHDEAVRLFVPALRQLGRVLQERLQDRALAACAP